MLGDINFDKDDSETIIHNIAWRNTYKQRKALKELEAKD